MKFDNFIENIIENATPDNPLDIWFPKNELKQGRLHMAQVQAYIKIFFIFGQKPPQGSHTVPKFKEDLLIHGSRQAYKLSDDFIIATENSLVDHLS